MLRRKNQLSVDDPTRAARYWCSCVWVCVNAPTWPGTSFWKHPFIDLGLESVCVCVCVCVCFSGSP